MGACASTARAVIINRRAAMRDPAAATAGVPSTLRLSLRWLRRWQHEGLAQLDDLPDALRIDHLQAHQLLGGGIEIDVDWVRDHVIVALERDLEEVVLVIVGDADQRQPIRLDLIAERQ